MKHFLSSKALLLVLVLTVTANCQQQQEDLTTPPSTASADDGSKQCSGRGSNQEECELNDNGELAMHNLPPWALKCTPKLIRNDDYCEDDFGINGIWSELDCDEIFAAAPRPVHDSGTWLSLKKVYEGAVGGPEQSTVSPIDTVDGEEEMAGGFQVPIIVRQAPGKGRGVFVTGAVQKGDLVWSSTKETARFYNGSSYRHFLALIPPDIACDVMQWAYVQTIANEKPAISVDLGDGSFVNEVDRSDIANVGCIPDCKTSFSLYAIQDIDADSEILCDYSDFADPVGWRNFGL